VDASEPIEIADIVERVPGWAGKAHVVGPLEGGITNRNFLVDFDGGRFVVRIPGVDTHLLGIDRRIEREANARAAGLGFAPEVVAFIEPEGILVTRFVTGDPLPRGAMTTPEVITRIADMLRTVHEFGPISGEFDAFRVPMRHLTAARTRAVPVPDAYRVVENLVAEIAAAFAESPDPEVPCHNDLLNANFLRDGDQLWLLDWEYAGMNDRYFDLANLAINNTFLPDAEETLVEAYFGAVTERRLARLRLMKIVSDAREATWALVQQGISIIEFDYPTYAQEHLDRLLANAGAADYRELLQTAAQPESNANE
jgi:thiamine kinase-like enzyme